MQGLSWYKSASWKNYTIFNPNTTTTFLQFASWKWIWLTNVLPWASRDNPSFRFTFLYNYQYYINWHLWLSQTHRECAFLYPSWCWDWTLDPQETCDPKDPTKNWWWVWWCDQNTCKPVTTACTNGWTWWPQTTPVTSTTPWLCQTWPVWNFVPTLSWSTTNYTWSCNSVSWWNCSASYTPSTACANGWTWWPQTTPVTPTTPWLCQTWSTVWNFLSTLSWSTTNYTWSCNWVSWWNCSASYNPSSATCTNWWISWNQSTPITTTTTWLCQTWINVSNFVVTANWSTSNYSWACWWISWPNCTASYSWWGGGPWEPTCTLLTHNTSDNTVTCEWNNRVDYFTIDCWNGQIFNNVWYTFDQNNSNIKRWSKVCNYTAGSTYNPKCYSISNSIPWVSYTSSSCQKTINPTFWWGGWWGGGWWWGWSGCNRILIDNNSSWSRTITSTWTYSKQVTCEWWSSVSSFTVDCWNGTSQNISASWLANRTATATCWYTALANTSFAPTCKANTDSTIKPTCMARLSIWWPSYCWDWVLQRPNSWWQYEECEMKAGWWWPIYCNPADCTIKTFTYPHSASLVLWPVWDVVIWHDVNPYEYLWWWVGYWVKPYIYNDSDWEVYFDEMCVKKTWFAITWSNEICNSLWHIYPWDRKVMSVPNFKWDKNAIPAWSNYLDNEIITTIKDKWHYYFDPAKFKVRVAKPSVSTTWGWTSYIKNNNKISDVKSIVTWKDPTRINPNTNKNFVWASVSNSNISSYSKEVSNTTKAQAWATKYSTSIDKVVKNTIVTRSSSTSFADFTKFNWLSNVFIIKNKDFTINGSVPWTWPITYIVENWDLIINANITYADNIAFVVRWWNIIIDKNVTSINGTYISIKIGTTWWLIAWKWWDTQKQLKVNWSLYGDVNDLVDNRTYIDENDNKQLDVWTVVSFWSSIFRKTAPLTGQFIWEYLQSKKIAH
jgi:hypothetical protein